MPVVSGKSAGRQNIAKAGVNLDQITAALTANTTTNSTALQVPGLPRLTFLIIQTSTDAVGFQVRPEGAFKFGASALGPAPLVFLPLGPAVAVVPGVATRIEINMPCEAIRLALVTSAANAGTETAQIVLAASG